MTRTAIISVDGHVKASRAGYRDYIDKRHLEAYDASVKEAEDQGIPDAGNVNPEFGIETQWDSEARLAALETQGVVAEVLFPNGQPFQVNRLEDFGRAIDPELGYAGRSAYNRWLVDFCAEAPGRRSGQMAVSFNDVDRAVEEVHWAKDNGLGGIMMPPLLPGGTFFFDPVLDPVWATCQDLDLPISQHGGAGLPGYSPAGFASIMTMAVENAFFSNRSMWQMILGGVFERFPDLKVTFIETQVIFMEAAINQIDKTLLWSDDWMAFAKFLKRIKPFTKLASEYFASNCFVGVSPFTPRQLSNSELLGKDAEQQPVDGFHIGADNAMFGVDFPHFESTFPNTLDEVVTLTNDPCVSDEDARKILYGNAAKVYGFDLDALQPHIDKVGFELDDPMSATFA